MIEKQIQQNKERMCTFVFHISALEVLRNRAL